MNTAAVLRTVIKVDNYASAAAQMARFDANSRNAAKASDTFSKATGQARGELSRFSKSTDGANIGLGRFNRNMMSLGNAIKIIKWPALIAGAGQAAQMVGALGAALVGVVSAMAPLAGAVAGYAGLWAAAAQGMGVARLALSGVSKALGGDKKALQALTPAQRTFVTQLQDAKTQLKGLQQTAAAGMLPGFGKAIQILLPLINSFKPIIAATAQELGNLAVKAAEAARAMGPAFHRIASTNVSVIGNLGNAAISAGRALVTLIDAARPLTLWMSEMVRQGAEWVRTQLDAAKASGQLADFLDHTRSVMTTLGHIAGNLAVGIFNIAKASVPLGTDLLSDVTKLTAKFKEWTQSAAGQNKIAAYFKAASGPAHQVFGLIGDIAKALASVMRPQPGTAGMIGDLRKLVGVLGQVLSVTSRTLGPALIGTLTNIGRIFGSIAGTSGPLTLLFQVLSKITGAIADLVQHNPGMSTTLSFMLGLGGTAKIIGLLVSPFAQVALKVGVFIGALKRVPAAITGIRVAMTALGAHPMVAPLMVLGLAIGFALTHMKQFKLGTERAWNSLKQIFGQGVSTILGWLTGFMRGIAAVLDAASHLPFVGSKVGEMRDAVNRAADSIDRFRQKARGWGTETEHVASRVGSAWGNASQNMQRALSDMLRKYGDFHTKVGTTNDSLVRNYNRSFSLIQHYIQTHTGAAKARAQADLAALQASFNRNMSAMVGITDRSTLSVQRNVSNRTRNAASVGGRNVGILGRAVSSIFRVIDSTVNVHTTSVQNHVTTRTNNAKNTGTANFQKLQQNVNHSVGVALSQVRIAMGGILGSVSTKTRDSRSTGSTNMYRLRDNIGGAAKQTADAVRAGMSNIFTNVGKALSSLGSAVKIHVSLAAAKVGNFLSGFAQGGVVNKPTYVVGEEAPRHKEYVIATNPAYKSRNIPLALSALSDLGVPGFAKGGVLQAMISRANWIDAQHFPYVYAGGHGSGFGPTMGGYDCSGAVSSVLGAGGWISHPSTWTGGLSQLGAPGPGTVTLYGNSSHIYMSLLGRFFGTSGMNPGGGAGWYPGRPEPGFGMRHLIGMPGFGGAGFIATPKIKGGGKLGVAAQKGLDKVAAAANDYVMRQWSLAGGGTHGDIGPLTPSTGNVLRDIYRTLTARGWTKLAIAGAMGNAYQESGWNPASVGSGGGGLWGFTSGAVSLPSLQSAAGNAGVSWTNVPFQTAFMAQHFSDLQRLNATGSPSAAAVAFEQIFERAGNIQMGNRIAAAQRAYSMGYKEGGIFPPYGGQFATGGFVPGPRGEPRTIVAHGGEPIGGPLIHIENMNVQDKFDERALAHRLAWMLEM